MSEHTITPEDAIVVMIQGTTMLKCGRSGSPHFRTFCLSEDMSTLSWKSPKKTSIDSKVNLVDIKEIRLGQKTLVFQKNPLPEYEPFSFSLIYSDRTLDIVAKDKQEFEVWVTGLKSLTVAADQVKIENINRESVIAVPQLKRLHSDIDRLSISFKGSQTIVAKREDSNDVYTWGQGVNGRLGHGDENDQLYPKVVETLLGKDIRAIACGTSHTAALNASGELFTWGLGHFGRLGHGQERDRFTPMHVAGLSGVRIVHVACGDFHTGAVSEQGLVYTWGKGDDGRLGHDNLDNQFSPKLVDRLISEKVKYIACGYVTTAVVTDSGNVFSWGGNEKGQLGHQTKEPALRPQLVEALVGANISQIACGTWHTVAVSAAGEIYTWGNGANGKLGHADEEDQLVPKKIENFQAKAQQIACGDFHTVVLADGVIYSWGEGNYGQLGHGPAISQYNKPLAIGKPLEGKVMVQLACGANHTAALTENGHLYTWGYAVNGRLGHGSEEDQKIPKLVNPMYGKHVRQIACGGSHSACTITHGWIPDDEADRCMACKKIFTFVNRRHHCRNCGGLFDGACTSKRFPLLKGGFHKPVRVCDRCHTILISEVGKK